MAQLLSDWLPWIVEAATGPEPCTMPQLKAFLTKKQAPTINDKELSRLVEAAIPSYVALSTSPDGHFAITATGTGKHYVGLD